MRLSTSRLLLTALISIDILYQRTVSAQGEPCFNSVDDCAGTCKNIKSCAPYVNYICKTRREEAKSFLRSVTCYVKHREIVVCCPATFEGNKTLNDQRQPKNQTTKYGPGFDDQTCGFSEIMHNRVVGGSPAEVGAWPWIAALGYRNARNPRKPLWLCGGTLISYQHVLTAAHCNKEDLYLARLGEHDLDLDDDKASPIDFRIVQKVVHPGYSDVNYVNDIAILKLERPVTFTAAVHPICLPTPQSKSLDYVDKRPFAAGWGSTSFAGPSSSVLMEVQVAVEPLKKCHSTYKKLPGSRLGSRVIDERVLCAGSETGGKDTCQGDSGGPLMMPIGNYKFALIGLVSFGYGCGEPDVPGVYTRVSHFLDFIRKNLQN